MTDNAPFVDSRLGDLKRRIYELETKTEKTMKLVNYVLGLFKPSPNTGPDELLSIVCDYHSVTEKQLKAVKSNPSVTKARQDYVLQLREYTDLTIEQIAERVSRTPKYVRYVYTKNGHSI